VTKAVSLSPFQEFDLGDGFWLQPHCFLHRILRRSRFGEELNAKKMKVTS
jgi:hypothetical protein